jgi:hypothetical protein
VALRLPQTGATGLASAPLIAAPDRKCISFAIREVPRRNLVYRGKGQAPALLASLMLTAKDEPTLNSAARFSPEASGV